MKAKSLYESLADSTRRTELLKTLRDVLGLSGEYRLNIRSNVKGARILLNGQEMPTGQFDWVLFPPIRLTPVAPAGYVFKSWNTGKGILTSDSLVSVDSLLERGEYELTAVYEPMVSEPRPPKVRINEVSSANDIYVSEYGKKSDWLELYNTTNQAIDLAGFYLSDDPNNPLKSQIAADPTLVNTVIPAHGFRIVWCDDRPSLTQLHVDFKLENADDAFVSITAPDAQWTDTLRYLAQARWQTFGRYADGGSALALFSRPTIELANSVCTATDLFSETIPVGIDELMMDEIADTSEVLSVEYYDLSGIRVTTLLPKKIYIEKTLFRNGQVQVRKTTYRHSQIQDP